MRGVGTLMVCGCLVSAAACTGQASTDTTRGDREQTRENRAEMSDIRDPVLREFSTNWRQLINQSAELAYPVVVIQRPTRTTLWDPSITSQCVFSPDAGGSVPQTTIRWNEPLRVEETTNRRAGAPVPPEAAAARIRLDLGLYGEAFARNQFSTALSTDVTRRFSLPASSSLIADDNARNRAGPGLFPRLSAFTAETLQERDSSTSFNKYTIVLRDLNQGVTYSIRVSRLTENQWSDGKLVEFLTPVCPNSF